MEEFCRDLEPWRGDGFAEPEGRKLSGVRLEFQPGGFIYRAADTTACDQIRVSGIDQTIAVGLLEDIP
jgi:hypothetical protein